MLTLGLRRLGGCPVNASLSRSSNEMFAGGPTGPVTPLLAWVSAFQQTTCPMQRAKAQSTKQKTCRCHCFLHLACVNDSSGFPGRSTLDYLSIILTFYTGFTSTFASRPSYSTVPIITPINDFLLRPLVCLLFTCAYSRPRHTPSPPTHR